MEFISENFELFAVIVLAILAAFVIRGLWNYLWRVQRAMWPPQTPEQRLDELQEGSWDADLKETAKATGIAFETLKYFHPWNNHELWVSRQREWTEHHPEERRILDEYDAKRGAS